MTDQLRDAFSFFGVGKTRAAIGSIGTAITVSIQILYIMVILTFMYFCDDLGADGPRECVCFLAKAAC